MGARGKGARGDYCGIGLDGAPEHGEEESSVWVFRNILAELPVKVKSGHLPRPHTSSSIQLRYRGTTITFHTKFLHKNL